MKKILLAIATLTSLILTSCNSKKLNDFFVKVQDGDQAIFSNRPQLSNQFIAILKLSNPPLLQTATKDDKGLLKINQDQLKAVLDEQSAAITELKNLSSEIVVLYKYKMVLNGLAVVAPLSLKEKLKSLGSIAYVEANGQFSRPQVNKEMSLKSTEDFSKANSTMWIGADKLHAKKIKGQGTKVGIIDTGVDFTHLMLGGPGSEEVFKSVDPKKATVLFPNKKVVGGIDLVGTEFNSASGDFSRHIPVIDENPIDESGHGTHVAGTVAGVGDSINTYDGVAPDAEIYAIKVFGAEGSTGDATVIAALEYSVDPTNKGTAEGKLDVINLSLGSSYGTPHVLYDEAVDNLVKGGDVIMVASAGNSGYRDFIVGAPSITAEAISVAASIDNMDHNWKFSTVKFVTPSAGDLLAEAIEGSISKPIAEAGDVSGKLVFAGLADADFNEEQAAQLKGNVALIDRGVVTFAKKVERAFKAGAIGVVVAQNQPGEPMSMGGDGNWAIPAIMITQALGNTLKDEMKKGDVVVRFQTPEKIERPELIDTLTGFSSKGPRSIDGYFKPEISAPGSNIISADMGKGSAGIKMSGTSMAAPHMAGVMALLKQIHPNLNAKELKSLVMGSAKTISNNKKEQYPLSQQGAGRVQVDKAAEQTLISSKEALSLGLMTIESKKKVKSNLLIKNLNKEAQEYTIVFEGNGLISMAGPSQLKISASGQSELALSFTLDATQMKKDLREFEGLIKFMQNNQEVLRVPVLAVARKISQVNAAGLIVSSTSEADSMGAVTELSIKNTGLNAGQVLLFNLLGKDQRKQNGSQNPYLSRSCDMQSAGYRIVERFEGIKKLQVLQVAVKLYEPLTSWNTCEVSVLIDSNDDDVPEQELAGFALENVKGLSGPTNAGNFQSVLFDATKVRELRKKYELESQKDKDPKNEVEENYMSSVIDFQNMILFENSTVAIIEADVSLLARSATGELSIKVATLHNEASSSEVDDFLLDQHKTWKKISVNPRSQSYYELPEKTELLPGESKVLDFVKGEGADGLLVLMPQNKFVFSDLLTDNQSEILYPKYLFP